MKKNIRYNVLLLLLVVEVALIPAFAQMAEVKPAQSISFEEYLKKKKKNMIEMYREYRAFHGI